MSVYNSLNCGYHLLIVLKDLIYDVNKIILNLIHDLLNNDLRLKYNERFPQKTKYQKYVDKTLIYLSSFIISDQSSITFSKLNNFERKIIYLLCKPFNLSYTRTFTKHHQGGSKTECRCGADGKNNHNYSYYDEQSSESEDCEVCEESGYVRNFVITHLQIKKNINLDTILSHEAAH
jgi:hypothetical protein